MPTRSACIVTANSSQSRIASAIAFRQTTGLCASSENHASPSPQPSRTCRGPLFTSADSVLPCVYLLFLSSGRDSHVRTIKASTSSTKLLLCSNLYTANVTGERCKLYSALGPSP